MVVWLTLHFCLKHLVSVYWDMIFVYSGIRIALALFKDKVSA